MSETTILAGDKAPDFELQDQNKNQFRLSDLKGKRILLSFHPLAWTGVCAKQMKALDRKKEVFDQLNTLAFGISIDHVPCKYAWAKELNITRTPLLSDFWPHGAVAGKYGLFLKDKGISARANVIIDEKGLVAFVKVYDIPELPDIDEIIEVLRG
jgi:peroxiredoxin